MSNSRQERLRLALANARQVLGKETAVGRQSLSKLNRLRGIPESEDTRKGTLLSRTGVKTRPVFDLVADNVLGETPEWKPTVDVGQGDLTLSQIANQRLNQMREKHEAEQIDEEMLGETFGVLKDGRPIWAEVLDSQRGYSTNTTDYAFKDLAFKPKWPPVQHLSDHKTWKNWHVVDENSRASYACEKVIEKPGVTMNPLLILGSNGCGKSHILSASVQAMIRRQDGNVHLLSTSAMRGWESLPEGWEEAVSHASLIAIDDLHLAEDRIATELGLLIDLALNHGVQIIATSRVNSDEWQARRLWEVMRSATSIWINKPSYSSLVTHLRRMSSGRALLLSDSMLANIVKHGNGSWRSTDASFEKVALAIESGEQIVSSEDITKVLEDAPIEKTKTEVFVENENLQDLASQMINDAIDHVYTGADIGGVELKSELPQLSDDWTPPELTIEEKDQLHEILVGENLTPHVTTTLSPDERDEFLIKPDDDVTGFDQVRVAETTSSIDKITEKMFQEMAEEHLEQSNHLAKLEREMLSLAEKSKSASVEELIEIADRVGEIESELGNISNSPQYAKLTPIRVLQPVGGEA